jgi:hypothetical protein
MAMKFHRMTLNKTADGRVSVTVDILGPISDPLEGLTMKERLQVYLWPFGWNERAMMRAVKDLPTIARRAVVADIMVARREKFEERQSKRAGKANAERVALQGVVLPRIEPKNLPAPKPLPMIEVSAYDVEPGMG